MTTASIKLVLDNRVMSNGKHRIYLRVIKERRQKKISTGIECNKEDFINESLSRKHKNHQVDNEVLLRLKTRALKILREYQNEEQNFTLDEFENKLKNKRTNDIRLKDFFEELIDEMQRAGRISNAKAYKTTMTSLLKYGGSKLRFKQITPTFLEKYEVYLRENGNSNGGISFKMRELRAVFNKAINRNLISKEFYPFDKYKISKLKSVNQKKALTKEEFKKFREVDLSSHPHLVEAHHFFLFSVYTRGMNFHDMMLLKWENIRDGRIYYVRSKTKGRFNLEILPPVKEILDYYKNQSRNTPYVFPILLKIDLSPQQIQNRKDKVISRYNKRLKELAKLAGIEKNITTYTARHSMATILKKSGTPIEKISEMMGHKTVSITNSYLKDFEDDELDAENRKFLDI